MASCLLALVAFHKVADSISAPHSSTCRFWFMTTVVPYSRPFLSKPRQLLLLVKSSTDKGVWLGAGGDRVGCDVEADKGRLGGRKGQVS